MRVRINIGLDFDGHHTFEWEPSDDPAAVEVAKPVLDRWTAEREAFTIAYLRWKRVMDEIDETLYRAEHARAGRDIAVAVAASSRRRAR